MTSTAAEERLKIRLRGERIRELSANDQTSRAINQFINQHSAPM